MEGGVSAEHVLERHRELAADEKMTNPTIGVDFFLTNKLMLRLSSSSGEQPVSPTLDKRICFKTREYKSLSSSRERRVPSKPHISGDVH